jgi:hypothetical protein
MKKNSCELVFILDKSGSMSGLESDTIGGFNANLWEFRIPINAGMTFFHIHKHGGDMI